MNKAPNLVASLELSKWNIAPDARPVITMRASMRTERPTLSDETRLISLINSGKTDLFYDLIRPHEGRLRCVALAVVRNETDAEDVVQETLLKAFRNLSGFRADARLSTWLISITLNEARSHLRRRGLVTFEPLESYCDSFWNATNERSNPYYMAEQSQVKDIVSRALSGLHPRYRNIYFLREVHELSTQRAAEQLGISLSVAKTRLHRARHLLQERVNVLMGLSMTQRGRFLSISDANAESSGSGAKRCKIARRQTSDREKRAVATSESCGGFHLGKIAPVR
jgi:RNA polymerase sigma-70 factor (ECF subfamily)